MNRLVVIALLATGTCAQMLLADQKTDDRIYDQVRMRLTTDPDVKGGVGLDVSVKDGVVTLKGHVDTEKAKNRAHKLAKKVKGVKDVDNELQVGNPPSRRLFLGAALLISAGFAFSAEAPSEQDLLLATAKLWVTVNFFHPALAHGGVDWDKALVDALPKIRAAKNAETYGAAIQQMLDALHDPGSHIIRDANGPPASIDPAPLPQRTWVHYGPDSAFLIKSGPVAQLTLPLAQSIAASVRLSEPISPSATAQPMPRADNAYADPAYPATEYRILAAYKIWGAVRYFFAYRDLMDEDWDEVFSDFLPKFIAAKDAREYNLAVAEAMARINDSNVQIQSANLDDYFGVAPVGLRMRLVEKRPLVEQILDPEATSAGIQIGDVVTKVDGEDVVERIKREAAYISFSTQQAVSYAVMDRILNGPDGSAAALTVRSRSGENKEIKLQRKKAFLSSFKPHRTGEVMRLLDGGIGYVDLERLLPDQIDSLFEKFKNTQAIILDGRGTLQVDPSILASRFNEKQDVAGAIVTGPILLNPDVTRPRTLTETASYFTVEKVPPGKQPIYRGKTLMLIDERTIGAAEHLGILMEAANNTVFVGSLSAGADGATTAISVPGGIGIRFSCSDVRHGNSGKLQRVGLQPTVTAPTTLSGVRAGRDEQLEKAIEYLSQQTL